MFERFCLTIHGTCQDGCVDDNKYLCVFWDSFYEECIFAESMRTNCRSLNALQAKDVSLDNILRKVNDLSLQVQALATKGKG